VKQLLFTETGTVELLDSDGEQLWSSEDDQDFRDEFGTEFLDSEDTDDVSEYLIDIGHLEDDEEIEVREGDLEDFDDDDDDGEVIEGEILSRG
jgi:hypothetical protein